MAEKKKSLLLSLPVQMCIGLVVGVIVGAFVSADVGTTWFKPLGDLFIRLIRMVVVPLVFATLVAGAAGITDISKRSCEDSSLLLDHDRYRCGLRSRYC